MNKIRNNYQTSTLKLCLFLLVLIGIIGVFRNSKYSGADEAAHFDYVNFVIDHHQLPKLNQMTDVDKLSISQAKRYTIPNTLRHEAVQPPLYYILSAFVCGASEDIYTRLIVLRIMGVLILAVSFYLAYRSYNIMVSRGYFVKNDFLFFALAMAFILSPSFQKIMIPLNNDHLLLLIVSAFLYKLILFFDKEKISQKQVIYLAFLVGAALMTKLTAIFLVVVATGYFAYKKWFKEIFLSSFVVAIMLAPWVLMNYEYYGSFTGAKQHLEIVMPIVNPNNYDYGVVDVIKTLPDFFIYMWSGSGKISIQIFNIAFAFLVFISIIFAFFQIRKHKWVTILLASLLGNFLIIAFVTTSENLNAIIGRYMYANYISFVILTYVFALNYIDKKYLRYFSIVISAMTAITSVNFIASLF